MATSVDSLRYGFYRQMEQLMMAEAPVIILYYDEVLRLTQKNVQGLGINSMNLLSLKRVRKI
jgi:ABC-type transport system substrate-binding protein